MKIFLDTADCQEISKYMSTGLIDGVTTNPSLIMKSHRRPDDVYQEIKNMGVSDISMEVVDHNAAAMVAEGHRLADVFGDVTTVKVPCTPDGLMACKELAHAGIRVNVTLIFNSSQAVLSAKAGAKYISPFVGRLRDNSISGTQAIGYIHEIFSKQCHFDTEILAASLRDVQSVTSAFHAGAQICTMPPSVFHKMYNHVLTDVGLKQFDDDWKSAQEYLNANTPLV